MLKQRFRRRGFAHERDLVQKLWREGFAVIRAPASGSKAKHVLYPDIVAIMNRNIFVFEAKTVSSEKTIYIPREQVEKVREFSRRAGGYGYIAVKIVGSGKWRFIPIENIEETRRGNYKVSPEHVRKGLKISDLVSIARGTHRLDEYL